MRIVQDGTSTRVYIRQSWLNDALMCLERARLSELHPEMRRENDSALMGTAVHSAIEKVINNQLDVRDIGASAVASFDQMVVDLELQGKEVNVTNTDPTKWATHIASMAQAWGRDIYPYVPTGGQTEHKFEAFITRVANARFEYELWFEGTMDYVHPSGIWDWKTAARKYSESEKQSQNIQSAVYATAATHLGLTNYTVNFNFGVMIRNASSTGHQVFGSLPDSGRNVIEPKALGEGGDLFGNGPAHDGGHGFGRIHAGPLLERGSTLCAPGGFTRPRRGRAWGSVPIG